MYLTFFYSFNESVEKPTPQNTVIQLGWYSKPTGIVFDSFSDYRQAT